MSDRPTLTSVQEIVQMGDPVLRNLQITRCYSELAAAVAGLLGRRDVNWLAFGAWASGTAGAAIRGEGLPVDLGTSRAVADGNLAIIEDVAPRFICWIDEIERSKGPTRAALERAVSHSMFESAPQLASALVAYQAAIEIAAVTDIAQDPVADKLFAEQILLGNVYVASHEQELADGFVDQAMPLGGLFGRITTRFVQVVTPDGPLDVCEDVPPPSYLGGPSFPDVLEKIANLELKALAASWDQSSEGDSPNANATTWESFHERMGYIFTFFRSFQRDERYYDVPQHFLA